MTRVARALVATAIGMAAALSIGTATAASHPTLSLPITFKRSTAYAHLSGHGFYARERVQITYTVRVAVGSVRQHRLTTAVYRRTATTDAHGSFTRPPLYVRFDTQNPDIGVRLTVTGARGDHAAYATGGDS